MRKILHLDMNSYFATLEQQAHPNLRGRPIGVAGKGKARLPSPDGEANGGQDERTVVCAASIEAKKFGIYSGISSGEATQLCPNLIIIPACYDRYIFTSKRIFQLLERFGPKVDVFSIDEAFLDLGAEISWADAAVLATQIKKQIRAEIGEWVTCSIGLSYGRTLAKLASEMQKPDGLTTIRPEDFTALAQITPIEKLCGIGWALRPRLNRMGIVTISDLATIPEQVLTTVFGPHTGSWLYRISHGVDDGILRSFRDLPQEKSIGHSYTLPHDLTNLADVKKVLLLLAERVGVRLRNHNLIGRTISVYLRWGDKTGWSSRQTQKEYIRDGYQIYQAGERQFASLREPKPVRLVAVSISDLLQTKQTTQPLFIGSRSSDEVANAVDKLNNRYGEWTVHRSTLHKIRSRIFNLPDGRDKRKYVPHISHINPFTKRI